MVNPLTVEEQRKAWTICRSVSGVTYYYNRATKKSQYQMPDCFKTTQQKLEHPEWKEYRTAEGKKFYYNSKTMKSVWQLPNEVKEWKIKMQQQQRLEEESEKRREEEGLLNVTDQSKKKIKQLMKQKHIDATKKWDDCRNLCREDPRWELIPNMQDKKALFFEYIAELKKTEDKEKKAKLDILKANFLKMLMQSTYLNSDSKMHKVTILFAGDQRWKDLDEEERQNVFQSYMDELYNKEKEEAREKKKFYMEALGKQMESKSVPYRMRWDQFKQEFSESTNFKNLNNIDRLNKFVEYILEAQKRNEENMHTQKMNQERINRENYRELLLSKLKEGKIDHKTRWPGFVKENMEEPALLDMMDPDQKGSSAHELFEDLMQGIREHHKTIKGLIKRHFKTIGFKITLNTEQSQFQEKLKGVVDFWNLRPITRDYFYYYFKIKIKTKSEKKMKKVLVKAFRNIREIKPRSSFYEVLPKIKNQLRDHHVPEDIMRKYFDQYLREIDDRRRKERSKSRDQRTESQSLQQDKKRRRKRDRSSSSNSEDSANKAFKKVKRQQTKPSKGREPQKKMQEERSQNDYEQQGQIKDSDVDTKQKKKPHKSKHKKRKKSSSSDSD